MRPKLSRGLTLLALLAALMSAAFVSACGEEEQPSEVEEGEPIELGELSYNVLFTRFLNPEQTEDEAYLVGQPQLEPGQLYLGVFMRIENDTEDYLPTPELDSYHVVDSEGNEFEPIESDSDFALEGGVEVPNESQIPLPDSTAESGVIEGSLILFEVDDEVTENRPLELDIETDAGEGAVILDI
ncbi:hypothetical protein HJD18_04935 [Thermoleophilia bacterium SCSIO 60948]|nr:hypothetical protein HJD18_04935 [Thermoleophilia bacterium SCSIO 60948]